MKMKLFLGLITGMVLVLASCQKSLVEDEAQLLKSEGLFPYDVILNSAFNGEVCGTPVTYPFFGQANVTILNGGDSLSVIVQATDGWFIEYMAMNVWAVGDPGINRDYKTFPYLKAFWAYQNTSVIFKIPYDEAWGECMILNIKLNTRNINTGVYNSYWLTTTNVEDDEYFIPYCWQDCEEECPPMEFEILAGQTIPVGKLIVWEQDGVLKVKYELTDGWMLQETHLFAGCGSDIPGNSNKNGFIPVPGQFPYHNYESGVTTHLYEIDMADIAACLGTNCIDLAAHAAVYKHEGDVHMEQTAWSTGTSFDGPRWGWYSTFCPCE